MASSAAVTPEMIRSGMEAFNSGLVMGLLIGVLVTLVFVWGWSRR